MVLASPVSEQVPTTHTGKARGIFAVVNLGSEPRCLTIQQILIILLTDSLVSFVETWTGYLPSWYGVSEDKLSATVLPRPGMLRQEESQKEPRKQPFPDSPRRSFITTSSRASAPPGAPTC